MSVTIEQLADELGTDPQAVLDSARHLIASSEDKVLTVGLSPDDPTDPVTCLTDQAASTIRARLGSA